MIHNFNCIVIKVFSPKIKLSLSFLVLKLMSFPGNLHIVRDSLSGYILWHSPLATLMLLKGAFRLSEKTLNVLLYLTTFRIFYVYIQEKSYIKYLFTSKYFQNIRKKMLHKLYLLWKNIFSLVYLIGRAFLLFFKE